tara:strand:+ start:4577 stop:4873 length:297 start_codon:yes stop_codon:yes gene_type:complete
MRASAATDELRGVDRNDLHITQHFTHLSERQSVRVSKTLVAKLWHYDGIWQANHIDVACQYWRLSAHPHAFFSLHIVKKFRLIYNRLARGQFEPTILC